MKMLWASREGVAPSALFNKPTEHPMSQPFDASKSLATLEQDNTSSTAPAASTRMAPNG
jgi:hypothetical protein